MQTTRTSTSQAALLRADKSAYESLNIVPYARNPTQTFGKARTIRDWDNGWDNCWHDGGWTNGPHPWQNGSSHQNPFSGRTSKLSDVVAIRDDGFIHNTENEAVFRADGSSTAFVLSIKDMALRDIFEQYPKVLEALWITGKPEVAELV